MTTIELKEHLINAHKRDLNLTLVGYGIVITIIAGLIAVQWIYTPIPSTYFSGFTGDYEQNGVTTFNYMKVVIPIAIIVMLIYPLIKLIKVAKRRLTIEMFIDKVENGDSANTINQRTVYKIIIPLIKINFKLYPVEFVQVFLVDDMTKMYDLPIAVGAIPAFKALLSGANLQELNKSWFELYGNATLEQIDEKDELKSEATFQEFLEQELTEDLTHVEGERSKSKKNYILVLVPAILVVIGWLTFQYLMATGTIEISTQALIVVFVGIFGVFYSFLYFFVMRKRTAKIEGGDFGYQFKTKIFKRIVDFINPSFQYVLHGHLSLPEVMATSLFQQKNYEISGNDQIIGKHKGVPFQLCDLHLQHKPNFTSEKEGPVNVFFGQVFIAKFNKSLSHSLYIIPKKKSTFERSKSDIKSYLDIPGEKVQLEDPEFMKRYDVYGTDQIEARYILSPALMERIKALGDLSAGNLFISFHDDRIYVFNDSGKNNFEPSMFKSLVANDLMLDFYKELVEQLRIIETLKLNVKIWKK